MPLFPALAENSEGGVSVLWQTEHLFSGTDIWKAVLGAHSLLLVQEIGSRGMHRVQDARPEHLSAWASLLQWLPVVKAVHPRLAWEA